MVEREPRKEIVSDSVGGLNIYGHLLWWTPHLVITKSIKSKKGFDSYTIPSQQLYNNLLHEGGP
jgi:hypothetical protein